MRCVRILRLPCSCAGSVNAYAGALRLNLGLGEENVARRAGTPRDEMNWVCGLNRTYHLAKCKRRAVGVTGCQVV